MVNYGAGLGDRTDEEYKYKCKSIKLFYLIYFAIDYYLLPLLNWYLFDERLNFRYRRENNKVN